MRSPALPTHLIRRGHAHSMAFGFTLIELMIAVAVVAILASVAYPSYSQYLLRSHRTSAQGFLTDLATRQHQFLLDTRAYGSSVAALRTTVPADVAAKYDIGITLEAGPPPRFVVRAVPKGQQAADKCGSLSIDAAGAKTPATCW